MAGWEAFGGAEGARHGVKTQRRVGRGIAGLGVGDIPYLETYVSDGLSSNGISNRILGLLSPVIDLRMSYNDLNLLTANRAAFGDRIRLGNFIDESFHKTTR